MTTEEIYYQLFQLLCKAAEQGADTKTVLSAITLLSADLHRNAGFTRDEFNELNDGVWEVAKEFLKTKSVEARA